MSIDNPEALAEAFKNSGELDRFQKELLAEFQKDEAYSAFKVDIGDIVRQRLAKAQMLHYLPQEMVGRDLAREIERYPIVDRAVNDMQAFSDPTFLSKLRNSVQRILQEDMEKKKSSRMVHSHDSQSATTGTNFSPKTHETGPAPQLADDAMDVDDD